MKKYMTGILSLLFICSCWISGVSAQKQDKSAEAKGQIKVAMLQLRSIGYDIQKNMEMGDEFCRKAKARGQMLFCFLKSGAMVIHGIIGLVHPIRQTNIP